MHHPGWGRVVLREHQQRLPLRILQQRRRQREEAFAARAGAAAEAAPDDLLAVVDEAAFRQRFGALPERLAERRAAWQRWADGLGVTLMCCDLNQPDPRAAEAVLVSLMRC